jgi:hypothetical protein
VSSTTIEVGFECRVSAPQWPDHSIFLGLAHAGLPACIRRMANKRLRKQVRVCLIPPIQPASALRHASSLGSQAKNLLSRLLLRGDPTTSNLETRSSLVVSSNVIFLKPSPSRLVIRLYAFASPLGVRVCRHSNASLRTILFYQTQRFPPPPKYPLCKINNGSV